MPKEMLLEKAQELRAIADSLESYAKEDAGEEKSESESVSAKPSGEMGAPDIKMAAAAIRNGLK